MGIACQKLVRPLQPWLSGQFTSSTNSLPAPLMKQLIATMMDLPKLAGERQLLELTNWREYSRKPCCTQEMDHTPFRSTEVIFFMASLTLPLYFSMQALSVSLQRVRLEGLTLGTHRNCRIWISPQESYWACSTKRRGLMNSQRLPDWKHSTCEGYFLAHSVSGMVVSARTSLQVSMVQSTIVLLLQRLGKSRIMVPLSGTMSTPSLLEARSQTQLLQMKAASPPAEVPVMVMLVAEKRPNCWSRKAKLAMVMLLPRKYRLRSLYWTGFSREPTCSEPSQQGRKTLFQVWKGLVRESGVRKGKSSKDLDSGQSLLLPRLVKDRLQQQSIVAANPSPLHSPPLSKQMRNLSLSLPA